MSLPKNLSLNKRLWFHSQRGLALKSNWGTSMLWPKMVTYWTSRTVCGPSSKVNQCMQQPIIVDSWSTYKFAVMVSQPTNFIHWRTLICNETKSWRYICWLIMMCLFWSWWAVAELIHFRTFISGIVILYIPIQHMKNEGTKRKNTKKEEKSQVTNVGHD